MGEEVTSLFSLKFLIIIEECVSNFYLKFVYKHCVLRYEVLEAKVQTWTGFLLQGGGGGGAGEAPERLFSSGLIFELPESPFQVVKPKSDRMNLS